MGLSLVIITRDAGEHIARCIRSVPRADQILVVDSGSADDTVGIARGEGAEVLRREFAGYADQKNWAAGQASEDWILSLDADEYLSEELSEAMISRLKSGPDCTAYSLRFRMLYMGRLMRFGPWSGEKHIRLFRKDSAEFRGGGVHEGISVTGGRTGTISRGYVVHESYSSLAAQMDKMLLYARLWSREQYRRGRRASGSAAALRAAWRFFSGYFLRGGFLEGVPGLAASGICTFYVFYKWLLLHEMGRQDEKNRHSNL